MMPSLFLLFCQALFLLLTLFTALTRVTLSLPWTLFRCVLGQWISYDNPRSCIYYEGNVTHTRRSPVVNRFTYPLRLALINLDESPRWFRKQSRDHWTAEEVRKKAGTQGAVWLLTCPLTDGYIQNPISVYYCYSHGKFVEKCIAEVTSSLAKLEDTVHKALHVSPFMDMDATWTLRTEISHVAVFLAVRVCHAEMGLFFDVVLSMKRSRFQSRNEYCGVKHLLKYGWMPHRVAFWIYHQAWRLWRMGVPLYPYQKRTALNNEPGQRRMKFLDGRQFIWRDPKCFPWNAC